jgi:hypothetical protein
MTEQPQLTEAEWGLIIELLEREHSELPAEIHHTRTPSVRDELRARHTAVHELLDRVKAIVTP